LFLTSVVELFCFGHVPAFTLPTPSPTRLPPHRTATRQLVEVQQAAQSRSEFLPTSPKERWSNPKSRPKFYRHPQRRCSRTPKIRPRFYRQPPVEVQQADEPSEVLPTPHSRGAAACPRAARGLTDTP